MKDYKIHRRFTAFVLTLVLSCAILLMPMVSVSAEEVGAELGVGVMGDVNGDKEFNLKDISELFRGVYGSYDRRWDLNNDGKISLIDVFLLYKTFVEPQGL